MTLPDPPAASVRSAFCASVLTIIVVLFAVRNLPWHLDDLDQAKQAFTSFQIVHGGSWFYQETPDGDVATKPPFAAWVSVLIYRLCGSHCWDLAWRLPSFACALWVLWTLARSGAQLFGNNIGALLAAGAFGLNSFAPRIATLVRTDMMLTAFIFCIGWMALEKLRADAPWTRSEQWITFGLFLAALMTKGPIVYAFLVPGWLAFHFMSRRLAWKNRVCAGWWTWILPLVVFALWAGIGIATDTNFYEQVVLKEFVGRFTVGEHARHHNSYPGLYTLGFLAKALPWSLLLGITLAVKNVRAALLKDPALLWLACWTFGGLVFMEFVPSKRFDRIFPVLPPACLLLAAAARYIPSFQWKQISPSRLVVWVTFFACATSVGYAGVKMAQSWRDNGQVLVDFGRRVAEIVGEQQQRLTIAHARDEGILLYANHSRFDSLEDALEMWRTGRVDWLVISDESISKLERKLGPHKVVLETMEKPELFGKYYLIERGQ